MKQQIILIIEEITSLSLSKKSEATKGPLLTKYKHQHHQLKEKITNTIIHTNLALS